MDFSRNERVAEEIKKHISQIINNDLKDPRIDGLISVTEVQVTKDLRNAKIFISLYGDEAKKSSVFNAITNAKNYIKRELAGRLRLKYMPEISFKLDESIEYALHIHKILGAVKKQYQGENEEK